MQLLSVEGHYAAKVQVDVCTHCHLVWFEQHATMEHAIIREKRIKKWNRSWKISLIEEANPDWDDLAIGLGLAPLPSHRVRG